MTVPGCNCGFDTANTTKPAASHGWGGHFYDEQSRLCREVNKAEQATEISVKSDFS